MSRSFKKTPISAHTSATSEKEDKRRASRAKRAHFRTAMSGVPQPGDDCLFDERNFAHSNEYNHSKDGKHFSKISVKRKGRALKVNAAPRLGSLRAVYKALAK